MRLKKFAGLIAAASLAVGGAVRAQQAPAPSAGPDPNNVVAAPVPDQRIGAPIWIGIDASPLSPALAHQLRLKPSVGLMVDRVTYDGPAAKAGIREYDVLLKVDDLLIDDPSHFVPLFAVHRPGDMVTFTLIREGQSIETKVTLGQAKNSPGEPNPSARPNVAPPSPKHHSHGLRLPKINVRIDEHGDLVATDGSGRTLFRQPLDFTIDTPELPFSIHIEPKPAQPGAAPDREGR
jgi:membrane-associated protease RseP (regulator of RpoE activity)